MVWPYHTYCVWPCQVRQKILLYCTEYRRPTTQMDILLFREQDRTLMDAVHDTGIFDRREQETLNQYRHFKGVHSTGNILCSNWHTIDPTMLTKVAGQSFRDFTLQVPTGPDHKLWLKMIHSLTQAGHRLLRPLGRYIGAPHRPDVWFLSETLGFLFKVDPGGHDVYTLNQTPCSRRYGTTYTYSHHDADPCLEAQCATITNWLGCTIKLHSSSPSWSPWHVHRPNQLLATLASWEYQSLWKHLRIDGGAGDGSYMPHLANNVCAYAAVIYCSHTNTNHYVDVT